MKKFYILLAVALLIFNTSRAQWNALVSGTTNNLYSVCFTTSTTGYIIGGSGTGGTVTSTLDGGASWTTKTIGTPDCYGIEFPDLNTGFIAGFDGTIMKTTNAGTTWLPLVSGVSRVLWSIFFTDFFNGVAVGDLGTIVHTTNGGATWATVNSGTTNSLRSVFFASSSTGVAVGANGTVLRTTDGGSTWNTIHPATTSFLRSVHFPDWNTGYAVGSGGTVIKTNDAGLSWSVSTPVALALNSVFFTDILIGYAVASGGQIMKTTNGGANWYSQPSGTGNNLNCIYFTDATTGYIIGDAGTILKTTNGGSVSITEAGQVNSRLTIYPNPVKDFVTIGTGHTQGRTVLTVYSSSGQVILNQAMTTSTARLDISAWNSGVYLVKVETGSSVSWGKIVK
ncbi:MAG: YCF48-related protein [Bacteroidetes bacterium]|nr:YCF48-related protein [Bacteroidota bacterium]